MCLHAAKLPTLAISTANNLYLELDPGNYGNRVGFQYKTLDRRKVHSTASLVQDLALRAGAVGTKDEIPHQ